MLGGEALLSHCAVSHSAGGLLILCRFITRFGGCPSPSVLSFPPGKEGKEGLPLKSGVEWLISLEWCSLSLLRVHELCDICRPWATRVSLQADSQVICCVYLSQAGQRASPTRLLWMLPAFPCCSSVWCPWTWSIPPPRMHTLCHTSRCAWGLWSPSFVSFHLFSVVTQNLWPSDNKLSPCSFATGLLCTDNFLLLLGNYHSAPLPGMLFYHREVWCALFTQQ